MVFRSHHHYGITYIHYIHNYILTYNFYKYNIQVSKTKKSKFVKKIITYGESGTCRIWSDNKLVQRDH